MLSIKEQRVLLYCTVEFIKKQSRGGDWRDSNHIKVEELDGYIIDRFVSDQNVRVFNF